MRLSIIAPMFNEELNVNNTYNKICEELESMGWKDYEIIFVNDGSTDNSFDEGRDYLRSNLPIWKYWDTVIIKVEVRRLGQDWKQHKEK